MNPNEVNGVSYAEFRAMLAEGFHTAFRKASDCDQAWPIWKLIGEMPGEEWASIISFAVDPVWDELRKNPDVTFPEEKR